ncbi:hypothetical protein [Clostridium sp. BJN0013]|uniref:hypothetical protein n=1 Tax=Clostridium sp. BJN0013 TaxID=3236840 RepID=UPI0034C5DAA7
MSKILCLKHSNKVKVKLRTILRNSRIIDFIDVNEIIKEQLKECKRAINAEVKALIREQKRARKYNENIQSSIIYGQGKITRTRQILKSLSGF